MRCDPDFFLDLEQMAKVRAGAAQAVFKGCNEPDERFAAQPQSEQ
jgi:hypothetical protein